MVINNSVLPSENMQYSLSLITNICASNRILESIFIQTTLSRNDSLIIFHLNGSFISKPESIIMLCQTLWPVLSFSCTCPPEFYILRMSSRHSAHGRSNSFARRYGGDVLVGRDGEASRSVRMLDVDARGRRSVRSCCTCGDDRLGLWQA